MLIRTRNKNHKASILLYIPRAMWDMDASKNQIRSQLLRHVMALMVEISKPDGR